MNNKTTEALSLEYEAQIREHVATMSNYSLGNLFARDLLAELDRVRAERDQYATQLDGLHLTDWENQQEYRAMVIAERDAQITAWLGKKAHEYGISNRENRAKAEAVGRMADKLSRGAVRSASEGGAS